MANETTPLAKEGEPLHHQQGKQSMAISWILIFVAGACSAVVIQNHLFLRTRIPINHVSWGPNFMIHQAQVSIGMSRRRLRTSGQVAPLTDDGMSMVDPSMDMKAQVQAALDNIDTILQQANMQRSDIVMVHFYTTDVDAFLQHYGVYTAFAPSMPPATLVGVTRLALPDLLIEIEIEAEST